jgi:hypothetical protein
MNQMNAEFLKCLKAEIEYVEGRRTGMPPELGWRRKVWKERKSGSVGGRQIKR